VGSTVRVTGRVQEFRTSSRPCDLRLTEIVTPQVTVTGTGALPEPIMIDDVEENTQIYPTAAAFYESMEGMLVQYNSNVVTGGTAVAFGATVALARFLDRLA
jgi:predicted extracellular nuclease